MDYALLARSPHAPSSEPRPQRRSRAGHCAAMRSLAQRVQLLDAEVAAHDRALRELIDQAAPHLIAERGIGYITAAQFYLSWSHPGRCHSEAAFARLGGTSPVPATSGPEPDPASPQPRRRPPAQPCALPRRRHQATLRPGHPRLHRPPRRRRQDRTRGHPLHQALPRSPCVAPPRALEHQHLLGRPSSAAVTGGRRSAERTLEAGPVDRVASILTSATAAGRGLLATV